MLGDLNFAADQPEHAILTGLTGLRDVAAELDSESATVLRENPYRAHSRKPDRRVDYVFARDGGGTAVVPLHIRRVFDERLDLDGAPGSCSNHAGVLAELELVPGAGRALAGPNPGAVSLASQFLREGRQQAKQRRRGDRVWAGAGLGAAALASLGVRDPRISRRRLLRTALQAGALLALTPGVGLSIVSEVLTPEELRAFDRLAVRLSHLHAGPGSAYSA
jgi:hypothetical protein